MDPDFAVTFLFPSLTPVQVSGSLLIYGLATSYFGFGVMHVTAAAAQTPTCGLVEMYYFFYLFFLSFNAHLNDKKKLLESV